MTKIISLSDEAYKKLSLIKGQDSFTKVILRMVEINKNKEKLLEFAGRGGIGEKEIINLKKDWNKWSKRYV